jgi:hypothetical protein
MKSGDLWHDSENGSKDFRMAGKLEYESNPKHKEPWHHGKSGTLCPRWSWDFAQQILESSEAVGKGRYAVQNGIAFKAHEHAPGKWHGHPVSWNEVDQKLVNQWIQQKRVKRREVRRLWTSDELDNLMRSESE